MLLAHSQSLSKNTRNQRRFLNVEVVEQRTGVSIRDVTGSNECKEPLRGVEIRNITTQTGQSKDGRARSYKGRRHTGQTQQLS